MLEREEIERTLFDDAQRAEDRFHKAVANLCHTARGIVQNPMKITDEMIDDWRVDVMRIVEDEYKLAFNNLKERHKAIRAYVKEKARGS